MAPRFSNPQLEKLLQSSQGKSYTVTAVTVLLLVVLVLIGVFPAVSAILFKINENGDRLDALAQITLKETTLRGLISREQDTTAVTAALNYYMPDAVSQDSIYRLVAQQGEISGAEILNIRFSDIGEKRSLVREFKVPNTVGGKVVNISASGSRNVLLELLRGLEESRRIINILGFSEFRSDTVDPDSFRMEIQAEFYFWDLDTTNE